MDDLLQALPPEMREEAERRWQERQRQLAATAPQESPEPIAEEETEAVAPAETGDAGCGLRVLDTNADGSISGADRQWRFLRLWFDDGDGEVSELEIESLYDLGVRQIDTGLGFYVDTDGDSEDIDTGDRIELAAVGIGNADRRRGVLVVDADRLARGGLLTLTDAAGAPLSGYQALGPGTLLVDASGNGVPAVCP